MSMALTQAGGAVNAAKTRNARMNAEVLHTDRPSVDGGRYTDEPDGEGDLPDGQEKVPKTFS